MPTICDTKPAVGVYRVCRGYIVDSHLLHNHQQEWPHRLHDLGQPSRLGIGNPAADATRPTVTLTPTGVLTWLGSTAASFGAYNEGLMVAAEPMQMRRNRRSPLMERQASRQYIGGLALIWRVMTETNSVALQRRASNVGTNRAVDATLAVQPGEQG
jgi:hypothetical protein